MKVVTKKKILDFSLDVLAMLSIFVGVSCIVFRAYLLPPFKLEDFNLLAARLTFARGNMNFESIFSLKPEVVQRGEKNKGGEKSNIDRKNENNNKVADEEKGSEIHIEAQSGFESIVLPEIPDGGEESHPEGEKKYPVIEKSINSGGTKFENFYVKNTTGKELDLKSYLERKPEVNIKQTSDPQVLIVHTHTSESYLQRDEGFFYDSFYPRTLENSKNVTQVGQMIFQTLKSHGINAIHSVVYHDNPSYNGSYARAAKTIKENLEKYPSIQVVIDVHRDSMGSKETGKVKPTFTFQGKKASQIMIICGCDPDGSVGFPNWEKNLSLALRLQKYCESMFPGMTRPLNFAKVKYNEHLTPGSLLVEVGSDVNTLKESLHTGFMFGTSLAKMLTDLKQ